MEWFGDGLVIMGTPEAPIVRRYLPPALVERMWSCMACGHEVRRTSPLERLLESIARVENDETDAGISLS